MAKKSIKLSINDVAKEAGVAKSTISFVINNTRNIRPETKEKVIKAIKKLKYKPNIVASSLRNKKSKTIGLVIMDYYNPLFTPIIKGIESVAAKYDYLLVSSESNLDINNEKKIIENLKSRFIDGIILNTISNDNKYLNKINSADIPIVFLGSIEDPLNQYHYVNIDEYMGSYKVTEHLLQNNHKKILWISIKEDLYVKLLRLNGHIDALKKFGVKFDPGLTINIKIGTMEDDYIKLGNIEDGYKIAKKIFNSNLKFSAIICWNDLTALGVMNYCKDNNIKIPEDFSIIGYENLFFTPFLSPPLTTLSFDKKNLGIKSAELLFDLIKNNKIITPHVIINTNIVKRGTVRQLGPIYI